MEIGPLAQTVKAVCRDVLFHVKALEYLRKAVLGISRNTFDLYGLMVSKQTSFRKGIK